VLHFGFGIMDGERERERVRKENVVFLTWYLFFCFCRSIKSISMKICDCIASGIVIMVSFGRMEREGRV